MSQGHVALVLFLLLARVYSAPWLGVEFDPTAILSKEYFTVF